MSSTASRAQHLVPAIAVLVLALTVVWLSFTREPAAAFLFPRLIASVMLLLAVWNCARAALGLARVGTGLELKEFLTIAPGVLVVLVYVLFAARWLGFYTASLATFIILYSLYDPSSHLKITTWLRRIAVSVIFMAVIYGLFSLLLKVQTPRGLNF
jgi:hypothetical protein